MPNAVRRDYSSSRLVFRGLPKNLWLRDLRIVKGFLDMYVQLNPSEEIKTWICDFRVRAKV